MDETNGYGHGRGHRFRHMISFLLQEIHAISSQCIYYMWMRWGKFIGFGLSCRSFSGGLLRVPKHQRIVFDNFQPNYWSTCILKTSKSKPANLYTLSTHFAQVITLIDLEARQGDKISVFIKDPQISNNTRDMLPKIWGLSFNDSVCHMVVAIFLRDD